MERNPYSARLRIDESGLSQKRLDVELTERCNNNCIHCYINLPAHDQAAMGRELSTKEIKEILRQAASLDYLTVRFTGGEPLLREDFEDLYRYTRKLGFRVFLSTNATLITPRLVELFVHIPPLERIRITVYGMKKKSYEGVTRVPGSFEAAWQGIELLLGSKVPFEVKGVLLPPNSGEAGEFEAWAAAIPWMEKEPSYPFALDLRCRRDSEDRNRLIKGLRLSPEDILRLRTKRTEEYVKGMREFCSRFTRPMADELFSCGAGLGGGCVDAYGCFQLCLLLRHPDTVYEVKNGSLEDARENFFPKIRRIKASNPDYLARCAHCFLKGLCEQCPAKSWMEHGTLDTPVEYLCEIAHIQARYLGLLEDGEAAWKVQDWRERIRDFSQK